MEPFYYIEQTPTVASEKAPLIVLIHGYGSNERDLFSFAGELPADAYIISVRAPHELGPESYAWFHLNFLADNTRFSDIPQGLASRDGLAALIKELTTKLPVDAENVTLIGFSQGCILSYAIALTYPGLIKDVVGLSGYLNHELIQIPEKADFGKLRFFVSHGSVDQVVPVDWARKAPGYLEELGIPVTYKEYPVGHGVAPQNFYEFRRWMETK